MRLSCPNCSTDYEVPDAALAGRSRKLRCERCGHQWRTPEATGVEPAFAPPAAAPMPVAPVVVAPAPLALPQLARDWEPAPVAPEALPPAPLFPTIPVAYTPPPPAEFAPLPARPEPEPAYVPVPLEPNYGPAPLPPAPLDVEATVRWLPGTNDEPRRFGHPVDDEALAEVKRAVVEEEKWPEPDHPARTSEEALPAFLTAERDEHTEAGSLTPDSTDAEKDRFAELVYAARNRSIEYEPETPPSGPKLRTTNLAVLVFLLVVFVVAFALVEHRAVEHVLPGTVGLFKALGLK